MRRMSLVWVTILAGALIVLESCGGGSGISTASMPPTLGTNTGSVAVFGGDAPICNVLSFSVTITGGTLMPQGGGTAVSVISSGQPVTVNFASLMGFMTVLNLSSVPAGTYSQMTVTLSNPQMGVLDATKTPMAPSTMTATLTTANVTFDINPALQVTANNTIGLHLDFDMFKSVQTDASGAVTGTVSPVFNASPMTPTMGDLGEIDDLHGIVQNVTNSSSNSAFTGSFTLEQGMMGKTFTVNVTSSTTFDGVSGLSAMQTGTFAVVDTLVDTNGNLVAKEVNMEDMTNTQQNMGAFTGTIMSVTRDGNGNATQFTMAVRGEYPGFQTMMPMMSSPSVSLTSNTHFDISATDDNMAEMTFGPSTMGVGQNVVVNGQIQMGGGMMGGASGLNANSVVLTLQPVTGNFMSTLAVGSDGKTGGFSMMPCSAAFGNMPMSMLTFSQTGFPGTSGLSGLTQTPMLVNKGLLFYQPTTTKVEGINVGPGMVFVTKQVQQVQ